MNCIVCKSNEIKQHLIKDEYSFMKCCRCGFIFINNIDEDTINNFYTKDYFDGKLARFSAGKIDQDVYANEKIYIIENYLDVKKRKEILDTM